MSTTLVRSFKQVTRQRSYKPQKHRPLVYVQQRSDSKSPGQIQSILIETVKSVFDKRFPCLAYCFVARLHADVEALLAVPVIRLGQDVVDVVENIALMEELMVGLLELQTPAPEKKEFKQDGW